MAVYYKGQKITKIIYGASRTPEGDPTKKKAYDDHHKLAPIPTIEWEAWEEERQKIYNMYMIPWTSNYNPGMYYTWVRDHPEPQKYEDMEAYEIWNKKDNELYWDWKNTCGTPTEITRAYKWDPSKKENVLVFALDGDITYLYITWEGTTQTDSEQVETQGYKDWVEEDNRLWGVWHKADEAYNNFIRNPEPETIPNPDYSATMEEALKEAAAQAGNIYEIWLATHPKPPEINPAWIEWNTKKGELEETLKKKEQALHAWEIINKKPPLYIHNDAWDVWNERLGVLESALEDAKKTRDALEGKYDEAVNAYNTEESRIYNIVYDDYLRVNPTYQLILKYIEGNKKTIAEGEREKASAESALSSAKSAQSSAQSRVSSASTAVVSASIAVTNANSALREAKAKLAEAEAAGVPESSLVNLRRAVESAESAVTTAKSNLESAKSELESANSALSSANSAVTSAEKDVEKAQRKIDKASGDLSVNESDKAQCEADARSYADNEIRIQLNTPGSSLYNADQAKTQAYNDWQAYAKVPGGYVWQDEQEIKEHKKNEPSKTKKDPDYDAKLAEWEARRKPYADAVTTAQTDLTNWENAQPDKDNTKAIKQWEADKKKEYDKWQAEVKKYNDYVRDHPTTIPNPAFPGWEQERVRLENDKNSKWDTYDTHNKNPYSPQYDTHYYTSYGAKASLWFSPALQIQSDDYLDVDLNFDGYYNSYKAHLTPNNQSATLTLKNNSKSPISKLQTVRVEGIIKEWWETDTPANTQWVSPTGISFIPKV